MHFSQIGLPSAVGTVPTESDGCQSDWVGHDGQEWWLPQGTPGHWPLGCHASDAAKRPVSASGRRWERVVGAVGRWSVLSRRQGTGTQGYRHAGHFY